MNKTYDKSCNLNRSFEDDLKNRENSLNSLPSPIYPDRQFDRISFSTLHELRKSNPFRVIGHININSIRNKFEPLKNPIQDNIDILFVSETKLDDTYPVCQFYIDGYSTPYRFDRTSHGGGILLFIREDIPSKILIFEPEQNNFEGKSGFFRAHNPTRKNIVNHMKNISTGLDQFSATYVNLILLGDFNVEPEEVNMLDFLNIYNLKNLVKQKTCYENPENPSCINLILTNSHRSFQNTNVFETGLSDFHKITVSVLKSHFPKQKPNIFSYRNFKRFRNNSFRAEFDNELLKYDLCNIEYQHFLNIFLDILNKHAPIKKSLSEQIRVTL